MDRDEERLACDSCAYEADDPDHESLVSGDRCPECNEGYLEYPRVEEETK